MPETIPRYYVSSAVIMTQPAAAETLAASLAAMNNVEVFAVQDGKIVLIIEGRTSGELGATLSAISALPGVIAANMVFEHSEEMEDVANER